LPILDPAVISLKCTISRLICISEPSLKVKSRMKAIEAALDKFSDAELDRHTKPLSLASVSEATAYMKKREAESSEYLWEQEGFYLFLVAKGELAQSRGLPGVALEFLTRAGPSAWVVRRVPDPLDLLGYAAHFERNELICDSQRPGEPQICLEDNADQGRLSRLGQAINKVAATLLA
jgi:hypothetical protein